MVTSRDSRTYGGVEPEPIVVAVDGGRESRRALRWAARRARQLGCGVRVVTAVLPPVVASESGLAVARRYNEAEAVARRRARAVIEAVMPHASVEHVVKLGDARSVVAAEAHEARMIVVGTRRRERPWHRWRPSLTNQLTGLAACPVVSVGSAAADPTPQPAHQP